MIKLEYDRLSFTFPEIAGQLRAHVDRQIGHIPVPASRGTHRFAGRAGVALGISAARRGGAESASPPGADLDGGRDRSRPAHRGSARRRMARRIVPGPDHRLSAHPAHSRRRPDLPASRRPRRVPAPFRGRLSRDGSGLLAPARRGRHAHGSERGALDQLLGAVSVRGEDRGGKNQRRLRGSVDRGAAQRAAG